MFNIIRISLYSKIGLKVFETSYLQMREMLHHKLMLFCMGLWEFFYLILNFPLLQGFPSFVELALCQMAALISPKQRSDFAIIICTVMNTKRLASQIRISGEHLTNPPSAVLSTLSAIHKSACLSSRSI